LTYRGPGIEARYLALLSEDEQQSVAYALSRVARHHESNQPTRR
jgi:hypothetical protein